MGGGRLQSTAAVRRILGGGVPWDGYIDKYLGLRFRGMGWHKIRSGTQDRESDREREAEYLFLVYYVTPKPR